MKLLTSRTVWTFIALFVFHGLQETKPLVPVDYQVWVDLILTVLGLYFRANPQAKL